MRIFRQLLGEHVLWWDEQNLLSKIVFTIICISGAAVLFSMYAAVPAILILGAVNVFATEPLLLGITGAIFFGGLGVVLGLGIPFWLYQSFKLE